MRFVIQITEISENEFERAPTEKNKAVCTEMFYVTLEFCLFFLQNIVINYGVVKFTFDKWRSS